MSIVPATSETIPEGVSDGMSGTVPAFIEVKRPIIPPTAKEQNIIRNSNLPNDNVRECDSKESPASSNHTEHLGKETCTSLNRGDIKDDLVSIVNHTKENIELEVPTSSYNVSGSCKDDIISA